MYKKPILIKKSLPYNFLAEKMVLSCLLINREAIELTLKRIPIEAFYFKNHQEIFRIITFMYHDNLVIDILSLITFLQDHALLQRIGGIKILLDLINQVPNLVYLEDYICLIKDKFLRRSLIKFGYKLVNSSYITNIPLENILKRFENDLLVFTNQISSQKIITSAKLLNQVFIELKDKSLNPTLPGLSSGFLNLDLITQGFQNSDLIILAGRPSIGKTAFSLNISLNVIKESRIPVLFFSLEMSKEQIMYRILSMETNINQMRLKNGNLYQNDWHKLNKIIKIISKLPLFIDDTPNLSISDIRSKIKNLILEQSQLGLIIIDYLQLMISPNFKVSNRVQELSQITRSLKILAREFNLPIVALSQLSRNVDNRINQKPILSDLRESGSIEQDADLVLMLYKTNMKISNKHISSLIELIIAKQRNGPTGIVTFQFDSTQTKFFEFNINELKLS